MPSSLPRSEKQINAAKRAQSMRLGQSGAAGKRKRCRKGKSCGASCIHSAKFCLVDLPWASNDLRAVSQGIQNKPSHSSGTSDTPKPKAPKKENDNKPISEKLEEALPKFSISKSPLGTLKLRQEIDGHQLLVAFTPDRSILFSVDNSLEAKGIPYRTSVKIANQVRVASRELFKLVPDGTTFEVSAYTGDGKGQDRVDAYVGQGFSRPLVPGESQAGKVVNGKLTPVSPGEYFADNSRLEFRESSTKKDVEDWHIILFGVPINGN